VTAGLRRLRAALDDRLGLGQVGRRLAAVTTAGPPRWARVPGGLLLGLIAAQALTGVGLAFFYSPGTASSWGSVFHIEERVVLGSVVRGLHAANAGAIVVVLAAHVLSAGLRACYRAPREVAWLLGLALVPVVLGFALTGYLLPWDQKGYWATRVATSIMRATPAVGEPFAQAFQGGADLGNLTLTRFYALHVVVLPAVLAGLLALHLWSLRRRAPAEAAAATPYWPRQAFRDALALAVVLGGLALWAGLVGAGLEAPADPTSDYPPRPEWYFMPLRQLLKYVPEPWGSVVLPGLVGLAVAALPWLDPPERPRPALARAVLLLPLAAALALGVQGALQDRADADYQAARARAEADAELAKELAAEGIPPGGAAELLWRHPPRWGERLFAVHCQGCHVVDGRGGDDGPVLTGYLSRGWLAGVIRDPDDPKYYGNTDIADMPPLDPNAMDDLPALAAFVRSLDPTVDEPLRPELLAAGEEAYYDQECFVCHELEPGLPGLAPNLHGYGSPEWLLAFLKDPAHELFYYDYNEMPAYDEELTDAELEALVVYLRTLDEPD